MIRPEHPDDDIPRLRRADQRQRIDGPFPHLWLQIVGRLRQAVDRFRAVQLAQTDRGVAPDLDGTIGQHGLQDARRTRFAENAQRLGRPGSHVFVLFAQQLGDRPPTGRRSRPRCSRRAEPADDRVGILQQAHNILTHPLVSQL